MSETAAGLRALLADRDEEIAKLRARVKELEEALREIIDPNCCCRICSTARRALGEGK